MKKFFFLFFLIFSTVFGNSDLKDFNDFKNEFIKHNHNSTTPSAEFDNDYFHEVDFEVDTEMNLSMNHFFENSLNFAPKNHSSCGFVSLIQVLSFYDTFYNDSTEEYYLYFKLGIDGPTIYTYNTSSNRVTFSLNSWTIIRNYTSTYLYVFLERNGQNSDNELIYLIINDPYLDMDSDMFTASNFNYNSTIASNEIYEQTIYCENMNLNYNISSTATYEEGESIIMSAKQAGIMTSFLEIEAEEIYRVDLNYNLYSNNEFVSHDVTEFKLQYMSNETDEWIDFVNLLDLASENNRMLKIIFPHSVSKIRFLLSPNAGMNYLNGRIKINSIELFMDN